ncbi:MAG: YceI family protein [Leptospira sp.]|nr:YceI family protein [Leptospira sp.]
MNPNKSRLCSIFVIFFIFSLSSVWAQNTGTAKEVSVSFVAEARFGKVNGKFEKVNLSVQDVQKGSATVQIDLNSISTGIGLRDDHLKGEDFFDVKKYPVAIFTLDMLTDAGENKYWGRGNLTIKGKTKEFTLDIVRSETSETVSYTGALPVDRKDFGINYDSSINPIKERVVVLFTVIFSKKKDN